MILLVRAMTSTCSMRDSYVVLNSLSATAYVYLNTTSIMHFSLGQQVQNLVLLQTVVILEKCLAQRFLEHIEHIQMWLTSWQILHTCILEGKQHVVNSIALIGVQFLHNTSNSCIVKNIYTALKQKRKKHMVRHLFTENKNTFWYFNKKTKQINEKGKSVGKTSSLH